MQLLGKLLGDPNKKEINRIQPLITKINDLEPEIKKLSDAELTAKTEEFRSQLALHLKGGMVLENELVKLFREALIAHEPLAERVTDEQLHAALTEYRQKIDRHSTAENGFQDTLSECFEKGYENLMPLLAQWQAQQAIEQMAESPEKAADPQAATLALLAKVEPQINDLDKEYQTDGFKLAWKRFEEARKGNGTDEAGPQAITRLLVDLLTQYKEELAALKADEMDKLIPEMAKRYKNGKTLDDLLPEAFAVAREAGWRTIKMRHYDVQLIGGIVLHQGKIAEMGTGEGKTLVATLPIYLNALTGKGVHLVTVNDYLAKRDSEWMGNIYRFLGLTVGVIVNAVDPLTPERHTAYLADITYGTNNEFGFDYLRDNMVTSMDQMVQRELNFAIVDEVDNILIDEARTPLIISGAGQESTDMYAKFARWVPKLKADDDYTVDQKTRTVMLTEDGISKLEELAGVQNIYDEENIELTRYMENALKAQVIFKRDKDYIVKDGEVMIVDEFTGRQMPGRRYSEGLHQAIEAKEGVQVQRENHTLATITFQNFFRLYKKLAGMTGTALTEAEELHKIYKLDVVVIPTNKPRVREDMADLIYRTEQAKYNAVVEEIKERHEINQPVLVGTTSVEISEHISDLLDKRGIPHSVLNAKHHEREAQIVAQAGSKGAVTIATNMAGRGTDILLGGNPENFFDSILRKHAEKADFIRDMPTQSEDERAEKEEAIQDYIDNMSEEEKQKLFQAKIEESKRDHDEILKIGGLHIIGTERHESRRIDNQLRGRAGRQGDPGSSRFYLSLEDELMRRFAADRVSKVMQMVGMEEDMPLESGMVSRFIEQAQTRVEGYNFDIRKNVVEYDDVIAKQREVIYADRHAVLDHADMHDRIREMMRNEVATLVNAHIPGPMVGDETELEILFTALENWVHVPEEYVPENFHAVKREELKQKLTKLVLDHYDERGAQLDEIAAQNPDIGVPTIRDIERSYTLQTIDRLWMDHIDALDVMRQGIQFRSLAQRDPLVEFKNEAYQMFDRLKAAIQHNIVDQLLKLLHGDITITVNRPAPEPKRVAPPPQKLKTNVEDIARASGQAKTVNGEPIKSAPGPQLPIRSNGNKASNGSNRKVSSPSNSERSALATASKAASTTSGQLKVGRNDPCPCGSGKKYKKCHGA